MELAIPELIPLVDSRMYCQLTLHSARDLDNLGFGTAGAKAWVHCGNQQQWLVGITPLDRESGINPNWNHCTCFDLHEGILQQGWLVLVIAIFTQAHFGDVEIGRVHIPLKDFVQPGSAYFIISPIQTSSGHSEGILYISLNSRLSNQQLQQPHGFLPDVQSAYLRAHPRPPHSFPPHIHPDYLPPPHGFPLLIQPAYFPPPHPAPDEGYYQPIVPQPNPPIMLASVARYFVGGLSEAVGEFVGQVVIQDWNAFN